MRITLLTLALCLPRLAFADSFASTLGEPLYETSHTVDVGLEQGIATFTVRRTFTNIGTRADEASVGIDLPASTYASGLRIRARNRWYSGRLLAAIDAAELYERLTGMGAARLKDPALLQWMSDGNLHLQVFPVIPNGTSTVEYVLTGGTRYEGGRYVLEYEVPPDGPSLSRPVIRLAPSHGDGLLALTVDGHRVARDQAVVLGGPPRGPLTASADGAIQVPPPPKTSVRLEIEPPPISDLIGRLGRAVGGGAEASFARLELDAAPQLSPIPKAPSVVFVVDASRSISDEGVAAQLEIARAYVSWVPDANVEIVVFRRTADQVFGGLVGAEQFDARLDQAVREDLFETRNGSALDSGLALAAEVLRDAKAPRRLVFTSDGLLSSRLSPSIAARAMSRLPKDTIVQAVIPSIGGGVEQSRDDEHALSSLASKHGGMLLSLSGAPTHKAEAKERLREEVLHLVRPIRIDHFEVHGLELEDSPEALDEGEGVRALVSVERVPKKVVVTGKLWARSFSKTIRPTASFDRFTAGMVFAEGAHHGLAPAQLTRLAYKAKAVTPVTSYLAIEPGVRPSREGIDRGFGGIGMGGYGTGSSCGGGYGSSRLARVKPDLYSLVQAQLEACQAAHPANVGGSFSIEVETTFREVVDVRPSRAVAHAAESCAVEAVWSADLPAAFDLGFETFSLALR